MLTNEQMAALVAKANGTHPDGKFAHFSEEDVFIWHAPKSGAYRVGVGPQDDPWIFGYGLTLDEAYQSCLNPKVPEWIGELPED